MPFLRFKGFEKEDVERFAPTLINDFAALAEVSKEKVKMELIQVIRITDTPLSVEIFMFQREQEKHNRIAAALNQLLVEHGYPDVHIFFVIITPELYYKRGNPIKGMVLK
jgi:hypothetical protein